MDLVKLGVKSLHFNINQMQNKTFLRTEKKQVQSLSL